MATTAQRPNGQYTNAAAPTSAPVNGNGVSRTASQRRANPSNRARPEAVYSHATTLPLAPEVPRGPPVSYRGGPQGQSPVTPPGAQSFSERLRANPRDGLNDQEPWDPYEGTPARLRSGAERPYSTDRRAIYNGVADPEASPASDANRRRSVRKSGVDQEQRHPQPQDLPPLETATRSRADARRVRSSNVDSPIARSTSIRKPANVPDEEWAHERSPLQTLELKLNDISKEEKRARVEEAEMLLRESLARSGSRRVQSDGQPSTTDSTGRRRSGQTKAPTRLSESTTPVRAVSNGKRPGPGVILSDSRKVPNEDRAYDSGRRYVGASEPADRNRGAIPADLSTVPSHRHPAHDPRLEQPTDPTYESNEAPVRRESSARRQTRTQQIEQTVPSNITRAVAQQQHGPPANFKDDSVENIGAGRTREADPLHKAALAGVAAGTLAGTSAAVVGRSNSRKLQKAPRKQVQSQVDTPQASPGDPATGQTAQYYARGAPKQIEVQRSASQRAPATVGLGLDDNSAEDPERSGHRHHHISDMFHHHKRPSISFKQAIDRPRPVDEWKNAEVARLTLPDMDLDVVEDEESLDKNKAWWEGGGSASRRKSRRSSAPPAGLDGAQEDPKVVAFNPPLFLKCGPLLRYTGLKRDTLEDNRGRSIEREIWRGTVMIVTHDTQSDYKHAPKLKLFLQPKDLLPTPPAKVSDDKTELAPELVDPLAGLTSITRTGKIRYVRPIDHIEPEIDLSRIEDDDGLFEDSPSPVDLPDGKMIKSPNNRIHMIDGEKVGKYREIKGHRIYADLERGVTFWRFYIEVELGSKQAHIGYRINNGATVGFWVPARGESMNLMFHSCNGFSLSVKPDDFSGPDPLWRDVLNTHQSRPFHAMIGGGDQIYNDRVMIETKHFSEWLKLKNPHDKHHAEFTPEMAEELETFYLNRYAMWFSQGMFGMANSQIPMVNLWDDHDIIDGFGSYPDHFMKTPVFSGLGNIAFKYYMLFQHQSVPEETHHDEPSWLLGLDPGPYIRQRSRNVFMNFGKSIAFLGLDCRTERKRDEIITNHTMDAILDRCRRELVEGETKHLIVLLGVPIAYPRLVWLENVLTSRAMDPIKALGRAGILKGGFLNKFDGGVEILDDLDDHWTASGHKSERFDLINDLQDLAAEKSCRITILGGDVHLAAVGQFYTNPKYKIPKDRDHRYMPNIVSSAICNTPPGEMLADILNKRNKIHHFDHYTDENMIPMFLHDVDGKRRNNKTLLPRRNWCSIREYHPGSTPPSTPSLSPTPTASERSYSPSPERPRRSFSFSKGEGKSSNIFRRLSLRGRAPPSSYRDDMYTEPGLAQPRSSSAGTGSLPRASTLPTSFPQSDNAVDMGNQSQDPHTRTASVIPRPGNFQRRPTNLSEKAAKRGGPLFGPDGIEEIDFNDHINLEGGLDIILNCEVSPKDPAGITTPYRLLVPALFYDGSSDAMHAPDEAVRPGSGIKRSGTFLQKLGIRGGKRKNRSALGQGKGNWGQDSESGSEEITDGEISDDESQRHGQTGQGNGQGWGAGLGLGALRKSQPPQQSQPQPQPQHSSHAGGTGAGPYGYSARVTAGGSPGMGAEEAAGTPPSSGGYNGVEAYKEKGRRRWF